MALVPVSCIFPKWRQRSFFMQFPLLSLAWLLLCQSIQIQFCIRLTFRVTPASWGGLVISWTQVPDSRWSSRPSFMAWKVLRWRWIDVGRDTCINFRIRFAQIQIHFHAFQVNVRCGGVFASQTFLWYKMHIQAFPYSVSLLSSFKCLGIEYSSISNNLITRRRPAQKADYYWHCDPSDESLKAAAVCAKRGPMTWVASVRQRSQDRWLNPLLGQQQCLLTQALYYI